MASHSLYSQDEDAPNSRLFGHSDRDAVIYSKYRQRLYTVSSWVCTTLFLSVLMLCAIVSSLFRGTRRASSSSETPTPKSEKELKLVPDLGYYIELLGLRLDRYEVFTEDGFAIAVQRIVDPLETVERRKARKPILLLHGLLQSSGSFCSSGKDSLAHFFHQKGYDVWLGNNRCGFTPRHLYYDPADPRMWNWDITEMAQHDITSLLNHVLKNTDCKNEKVILMCHSQGTTQGFMNLYQDQFRNSRKIKCFVALSPAVYGGPFITMRFFIRFIKRMAGPSHHAFFGVRSFLPIMMTMREVLVKSKVFAYLSYTMFNFLFDWSDVLWDPELRDRHFLFSPVHISVKLMSWWLNVGFDDSQSIFDDDIKWHQKGITPPICLVIPRKDLLVDGKKLMDHMKNKEGDIVSENIVLEEYSHLDVLWSKTVVKDVGEPVLKFIEKHTEEQD